MEPTIAHKVRNSLIQLIVWLILVWLASWYLTNHPAERQSIKSSINTARQKVEKILGSSHDSNLISQQRTQALSSMREIIAAIQSCDPSVSIDEYQKIYTTISESSFEDFARNGATYYNQLNTSYQKMQQLCNKGFSGTRTID